eukprot:SAG11_NODE_1010_length_6199_cov_2.572131_3_plen_233_part_00
MLLPWQVRDYARRARGLSLSSQACVQITARRSDSVARVNVLHWRRFASMKLTCSDFRFRRSAWLQLGRRQMHQRAVRTSSHAFHLTYAKASCSGSMIHRPHGYIEPSVMRYSRTNTTPTEICLSADGCDSLPMAVAVLVSWSLPQVMARREHQSKGKLKGSTKADFGAGSLWAHHARTAVLGVGEPDAEWQAAVATDARYRGRATAPTTFRTERQLFAFLGLPHREPHQRHA